MTERQIPILVYHHVYDEGDPSLVATQGDRGAGIIGVEAYRSQLEHLRNSGWSTVSTSRIVAWLAGADELEDRSFAIHFDNGWLDTLTTALPVTDEYGYAATCFPITDGVEAATSGHSTEVRTLTEGVVEKPFMNWDQIAELCESDWEIGAHTATHCKVADVHNEQGDDAVIREAEISNTLFERRLGQIPVHFAYPSGSRNERTDELLSRYYRSLRLWHFELGATWTYTSRSTSPLAIDCQNIDLRVSMDNFRRIFADNAK